MEQQWTKKRVMRLSQADEAVIEQWLDEYIHVIYTWQYYQVGADADISADLTSRTFKRAVESLQTFDPDTETMLEWLRQQGRQVRDEVLEIRGMKPQRPWAWSQLPDNVLCGLSHLRDEPLPEEVMNNPFVREIIQAALAEMEAANRELMMQRYNHLDTAEHIASETGQNIADINDRLYRCRHTFRRAFMQLIQSANAGFSESTSAGSLELLDANLEKLLSSTNMVLTVSPKEQARIREIVLAAARQAVPLQPPQNGRPYILLAGSGILLLVLILAGLLIVFKPEPAAPPSTPEPEAVVSESVSQPSTPAPDDSKPVRTDEEKIDQAELEKVLLLGQAGDLSGLLDILKNGQYTSQMAAALFIGRLGDESAIGLLEEAEMQHYPNGPENNPFAEAILQIEDRLLAESERVVDEPAVPAAAEPNGPTAEADTEPQTAPAAPEAVIQGTVNTVTGDPLVNAQVTLSVNPLYGNTDIRVAAQTMTNGAGAYQLPNPPPGAYFLDCRDPDHDLGLSYAVWVEADSRSTVDFGGQPVLSGVLLDTMGDTGGQLLYLSDTLNPANASFRAESVTDSGGLFSFSGIKAGSYYLLNATDTNGIIWLESVEMRSQEVTDRKIGVKYAALSVAIETEEAGPTAYAVALAYGPDVSDEMRQFSLMLEDDGRFTAEAIPFGSYTLISRFENGMRLQQPLELNADRELSVTAPAGNCILSGTFRNPSPYNFFLYNTDQRVRFDLGTDGDGAYVLDAVPADSFTLAAVVNGLQLDFMDIDLQTEPEQILDIDADELLGGLSPLFVAVTNKQGMLLSDARVWVTGAGEVVTTQSTGRGAFLALGPGDYSLFAALPGYSTAEEVIQVKRMPLLTPPNPDNTIRLRLEGP